MSVTSNLRRQVVIWLAVIAAVCLLPLVFRSGSTLSMMNLMGIMIIAALSYNILYGSTGLLSFGHAIYLGLGGYITIHTMNFAIEHDLPVPAAVFPLLGGVSGLFFAAVSGWICTRRAGTSFAMITLGLGELVVALSLIMTGFFGEEDGFSTNRTKLAHLFGYSLGPQIQVYYLIAFWGLASALAMFAIRRTAFGVACSAVRDNPERAEFIGYDPHRVRYIAFCIAGFFAGLAGALSVINFEIINATSLSGATSGNLLLMTYIGGSTSFVGPIIGATLITFLRIMLSDITPAWLMYYGSLFMVIIMYLPGGLAALIAAHWRAAKQGRISHLLPAYAVLSLPVALFLAGFVTLVELLYRVFGHNNPVPVDFTIAGVVLNSHDPVAWTLAVTALVAGAMLIRRLWSLIDDAWHAEHNAMVEATQ